MQIDFYPNNFLFSGFTTADLQPVYALGAQDDALPIGTTLDFSAVATYKLGAFAVYIAEL